MFNTNEQKTFIINLEIDEFQTERLEFTDLHSLFRKINLLFIHFDFKNSVLQEKIKRRIIASCKDFFATKTEFETHKKITQKTNKNTEKLGIPLIGKFPQFESTHFALKNFQTNEIESKQSYASQTPYVFSKKPILNARQKSNRVFSGQMSSDNFTNPRKLPDKKTVPCFAKPKFNLSILKADNIARSEVAKSTTSQTNSFFVKKSKNTPNTTNFLSKYKNKLGIYTVSKPKDFDFGKTSVANFNVPLDLLNKVPNNVCKNRKMAHTDSLNGKIEKNTLNTFEMPTRPRFFCNEFHKNKNKEEPRFTTHTNQEDHILVEKEIGLTQIKDMNEDDVHQISLVFSILDSLKVGFFTAQTIEIKNLNSNYLDKYGQIIMSIYESDPDKKYYFEDFLRLC